MPAQYQQILSKPVEFVMACDGAVREVVVSRDEPEWSLNFKKALIVLFQSTVDTYSIELEQNRVSFISLEELYIISMSFQYYIKTYILYLSINLF